MNGPDGGGTDEASGAETPAAALDREISPGALSAAEFAARLQASAGGSAPVQFVTWRPGTAARAIAPVPADARAPARRDPAPRPAAPAPDPLAEFFYDPREESPALEALGAAVESPAAAVSEVIDEYLTFLLGKDVYAFPIGDVREVLKAPAVTEVPRAPAHVLGVVTVRGDVVAVFDLRRRLGLPGPPPAGGRLVIVDAGGGACALLVDAVSSVARLPRGHVEPCPQGIAGGRGECLAGVGRDGERLFTVLDARAVFRPPAPREGRGREG